MARLTDRLYLEPTAAKVPEITPLFWIIKILTTAAGEATSDYLALHNVAEGAAIEVTLFVVALWLQLRARHYFAPVYWFLALSIAIAGTGVSDTMHLKFGIPYGATTIFWSVVLAIIFWSWHHSEGTLSIHSVVTSRRELFYWATVFATFALGTASGDFTAIALHLGFLSSALTFLAAITVPLVGWRFFNLNEVLAFWFAYVLTRPLGASIADYVSKPHTTSGINAGDGPTAVITTIAIIVLVIYVAIARNDIQPPLALE